MNITYRQAEPSDAAALLEYLKTVGGESNNLMFGAGGIPITEEQEKTLLENYADSPHSRIFLAVDGDKIVGNSTVDGRNNPRISHRRNIAISVLRDYWGRGVGSGLMQRMVDFAKSTGAEVLSLEVLSDNARAIALYRKFGFESFGTFKKFFKIDGEYFDAYYMTCDLTQHE